MFVYYITQIFDFSIEKTIFIGLVFANNGVSSDKRVFARLRQDIFVREIECLFNEDRWALCRT